MDVLHGAAHGGDMFFSPDRVARAVAFYAGRSRNRL
jgi:hypothetical protein